jgi:hypothetical protein
MTRDELVKEVVEFLQSETFAESGALDADGNVDFGPAGLAVQEFVEGLEADEDEAADEDDAPDGPSEK